MLYRRVDFGVDLDSRISIVGPNGAGKVKRITAKNIQIFLSVLFIIIILIFIISFCQSTLLKLILGELTPTDGNVQRHSHLVIGHFHQHLSELLDPNMNPLDYMLKHYPMERSGD